MSLKSIAYPGWLSRTPRNWLVRLAIMLPALLGFGYLSWYVVRPPSHVEFHATLHTKSVSFLLGYWPDSGGIFNSDTARIDMVLLAMEMVRSEDVVLQCSPNSRLGGVKMVALSTPERQEVRLDLADDGHLHYILTTARGSMAPFVAVQVDDKTSTQHLACQGDVSKLRGGEWHITPLEPRGQLEFSVDFVPSATRRKADPVSGTNRPKEEGIPLASGSLMEFRTGSSGLAGSGDKILLLSSDRTIPPRDGLRLIGLQNASIGTLGYEASSQSLYVDVTGSAAKIEVKSGGGWIVQTDNRFPRQISGNLGSLAGAIATFTGALLSFLATCITIRVGWMQHRERMAFEKRGDDEGDRETHIRER